METEINHCLQETHQLTRIILINTEIQVLEMLTLRITITKIDKVLKAHLQFKKTKAFLLSFLQLVTNKL